MEKKMLMLASVPSMIGLFNIDNIKLLQELGYKVEVACNIKDRTVWNEERVGEFIEEMRENDVVVHQVDFSRNIFKVFKHIKAYKQLSLKMAQNNYAFIHCHSPIGGVVGRIASKKKNIKCIYTAHGFHFFKGGSKLAWLLFYPIEKILSKYTDVLITINTEDYELARKRFKSKKIYYVPGVGYDEEKCNKTNNKDLLRKQYKLPNDAIILLTVGELNKNKNQITIIKALEQLNNNNIYYLLCGMGSKREELENYVLKCGLKNNVKFMGFRNDLANIYGLSDIYINSSYREGLNVSIMEAMANGMPCLLADIRGNRDLVDFNCECHCLVSVGDIEQWMETINNIIDKIEIGAVSRTDRIKMFSKNEINNNMKDIYMNLRNTTSFSA